MDTSIFFRIQRIDHLISIKGTGTPKQLAKRLNMAERTIYQYIKLIKNLGAPISYSRTKESYLYDEEGSFVIGFRQH